MKVSVPPISAGGDSDRMVVVDEDGKVDDDGAISMLPSFNGTETAGILPSNTFFVQIRASKSLIYHSFQLRNAPLVKHFRPKTSF